MDKQILDKILDNAEVAPGLDILDISGGQLLAGILAGNPKSVTAVNLPKETALAYAAEPRVRGIQADWEDGKLEGCFDRIVLYGALPKDTSIKRLLRRLAGLLKDDGRLSIAWDPAQAQDMPPAQELVKLFEPHFHVEIMVANRQLCQVSGVKRDPLAQVHCGVTHTHGGLTHTHTHGDIAHEHAPEPGATPIEELLVLMRYLVSHNDAHAQEVAELASQLQAAGKDVAYDEIMDAVSDFDMVNAKLDAILAQLTVEEF
ncbi:MAG TPA: hypothetical protein DDY87_01840 [Clostridiales bacterium]|nr:hypothetical protein [Clostridiales bacterium]